MADSKITALTAITTVNPATYPLVIVDTSDTSMAITGTTKKVTTNQLLGSGGTATLASATITGDLTVDTSTLKVDSTNNRVGVGTASPNNTLTVRGSQDAGIEVNSADSNASRIITAYDPANTRFYINSTSSGSGTVLPLDFLIGNSAQYRIAASGVFTWYDGAGGTRMTLNSTGLGVGASPSYKLHVAGSNPTAAINSTTPSASSISTLLYRNADGNSNTYSVASIAGETAGNGGYGNLIFSTGFNGSLVERMRIDLSGNVGIGVTPSAGKGCLQLSSGINFPATQVASSDANTLDDYEEGTWTPVIKFGATTATQNATKTSYTKIGRQVTCFVETYITNLNGGTGNFEMSGLPFACSTMRFAQGAFFFEFMSATFPAGDKVAFINDSSTSFGIKYFTGASGTSSSLGNADFTTSSYVYAQIVYFV